MTKLWLTRARLRRDASIATLAPVLLPEDDDLRTSVSHRLVWSLFADTADRRRDFLWREDSPGHFMVLSARPPEEAGNRLFSLDTKAFAPRLEAGDRLHFTLRANPTVAHAVPGRARRSPRRDVVMAALHDIPPGAARQQARPGLVQETGAAWMLGVATQSGFDAETIRADSYTQLRIPRASGQPIRLSTLDVEGVLRVTAPDTFLAKLAVGFGRAKAFGCGLMLIRRA